MKKIFSLLKKRFDLPSVKESRFIVRTLTGREKIVFWIFFALFTISTIGLLAALNDMAADEVPVFGGTIHEGSVGTPRFINPLTAVSDADRDLTELVYAGLLKPDGRGGLLPELAEKYEISDDDLTYTFVLKEGLVWHDGEPLTAEDIFYTIKMVQTPLVRSVKRANWEGVTMEIQDARTIRFHLKKPYAPFLGNATLEIIPKHIWSGVGPDQLTFSQFNIEPIGAGPYKIKKISRNTSGLTDSYMLEPFADYALGRPYIKNIVLHFYNSETDLLRAYAAGAVENIGAVSPNNVERILRSGSHLESMRLSRVFGIFFNQNKNQALTEYNVRRVLALATDKQRIINEILHSHGKIISDPIPPGTLGALPEDSADNPGYDPEQARKLLVNAGWKINEETGIAEKKIKKSTVPLRISISTSNAADLNAAANLLKNMWQEIGVAVDVRTFEIGDFDKDVIRERGYEALFFGEVVGYDPDPFAFWHSSQRNDPGLNIAMYANTAADKILDAARKISDPEKRAEKYQALQETIRKDLPAIFIYSPNYLYIVSDRLRGFDTTAITGSPERFANIHRWYTDTKKVWRFLIK